MEHATGAFDTLHNVSALGVNVALACVYIMLSVLSWNTCPSLALAGTLIITAAWVLGLACILFTKSYAPPVVAVQLAVACVGVIVSVVGGSATAWVELLLVLQFGELFLMQRTAPALGVAAAVGVAVLALEALVRSGVLADRDCRSAGIALAHDLVVQATAFVFIASVMHRRRAEAGAWTRTYDVLQIAATCLSYYDTDAADMAVQACLEDVLPEFGVVLENLVHNLALYRKYLPSQCQQAQADRMAAARLSVGGEFELKVTAEVCAALRDCRAYVEDVAGGLRVDLAKAELPAVDDEDDPWASSGTGSGLRSCGSGPVHTQFTDLHTSGSHALKQEREDAACGSGSWPRANYTPSGGGRDARPPAPTENPLAAPAELSQNDPSSSPKPAPHWSVRPVSRSGESREKIRSPAAVKAPPRRQQWVTLLHVHLSGLQQLIASGLILTVADKMISKAVQLSRTHRGAVDRFLGDKVLVSFNATRLCACHEAAGLRVADGLMKGLGEGIKASIVVGSGPSYCLDLGSESHRTYAILGPLAMEVSAVAAHIWQLGAQVVCNEMTMKGNVTYDLRLLIRHVTFVHEGHEEAAAALLYELTDEASKRDDTVVNGNQIAQTPQTPSSVLNSEWMYTLEEDARTRLWTKYNEAGRDAIRGKPSEEVLAMLEGTFRRQMDRQLTAMAAASPIYMHLF
eukprot:TRINITY_DN2895_c0_g4_i1.p1 TRINITY_DN2895_c0_g4~~TRINITY_DN2895_c0_g4_i1.p1  ORF type:complete len:711 (+),score=176.75 TRINITY_DN2895_c0_g4_i1:73-2133(+)